MNAKNINVVMGQCYSGGFINYLQGNNRIIATASREHELSYACSDLLYDEFLYHWMSAALEKDIRTLTTVDSDDDRDDHISAYDCFKYARKKDTKKEYPQYSSTPEYFGEKLSLTGMINATPKLRSYSVYLTDNGFENNEYIPQNYEFFISVPQNSIRRWYRPGYPHIPILEGNVLLMAI